jgi:dihydroorotase
LTIPIWKEKYEIAAQKCLTNFGFLLGIDQHNWKSWTYDDIAPMLALTDDGLYFSGKGKLLAQFPEQLSNLMKRFPSTIIALHCEDEGLIEQNLKEQRNIFGENIPFSQHHLIRSSEACLQATQSCIEVAKNTGGRLHVLHVTSGAEAQLFNHLIPFDQKKITAEVCVQNLLFCSDDYDHLGALIKWNPSIKTAQDREELWEALLMDKIDIITTDHAPHLWSEKEGNYVQSLSGAPMIQHSLNVMVDFHLQGRITMEKIVEKMCHRPAQLYGLKDRGFIAEGMKADLVILDTAAQWTVGKENLLYKCGWSPLEGRTFQNQVKATCVNGHWVYREGRWSTQHFGQALRRKF